MGTIADKLAATLASKAAIKTAIENKGVEVGIAPLREYAGLIDSMLAIEFDENCYITNIVGNLTIPDTVTSIGDTAFLNCYGLTSVTIPDTVTSIGDTAFLSCYGLTSVTIPDSVTSIGYAAFGECTGLASIAIPNSVISIGDYALACPALTSVTLGDNFDASLDLHWSTLLTASAMVAVFNKLKNNAGYTAKTLTLGSDNLAKLTTAQKAIATNKNWTLA